jgi:hypothetical protein
MQGRKFDSEKLRFNLIPVGTTEQEVKVLMNGEEKYDTDNWMYVDDWKRRYTEAAKRHIAAYCAGEEYDDGPGGDHLHHLAHALADLRFLLWKSTNRNIYLCGKMRGLPNYNFAEFFKWESILHYHGWNVFNPARMSYELSQKLGKPLDEIPYEVYIKQDLEIIENKCGSLFLLKSWDDHSEGAREEYSLAIKLGLNIYHEISDIVPKPPIGATF